MAVRNIAVALNLGGAVSNSVPTSIGKVSKELEDLKGAAAADRKELRRLQVGMRGLDKDSKEYAETAERIEELKLGLKEKGDRIRELSAESRDLSSNLRDVKQDLKGTAVGLGAVLAFATGLAVGVGKLTGKIQELRQTATGTGTSLDDLQINEQFARRLGLVGDDASSAVNDLAKLQESVRNIDRGISDLDFAGFGLAGLDVFRLQGRQGVDLILELRRQINALDGDARTNALADLDGLVDPGVFALLVETLDETDEALKAIYKDSQDQARVNAEQARSLDDLRDKWGSFTGGLGSAANVLTASLAPAFTAILAPVTSAVGAVSQFVAGNETVKRVLGPTVVGLTGLVTVLLGVRAALLAARGAKLLWGQAIATVTILTKAGTAATTTMTVATKLLNKAFLTSPIGLVAVALGVLVGGLITAYKRSESFRRMVKSLLSPLRAVGQILGVVGGILGFGGGSGGGAGPAGFRPGEVKVKSIKADSVQR